MRELRVILITFAILAILSGTAFAGGSWLHPYRKSYQPGEAVVMRGDVSPGQLGWVEDGPFYAYLRVDPNAAAGVDRFPHIDESDIPLGELQVRELSSGWVHVSLVFTLPDHISAGEYGVVYCNDPCTEGLGDLIGGSVRVVIPTRPSPPSYAFHFPI